MNNNESYQSAGMPAGKHVLGLFWDIQWVLRLMCMFIFIDTAMLLKFNTGVLHLNTSMFNEPIWILASLLIFGLLATVIIPAALVMCHFGGALTRLIIYELEPPRLSRRPFGLSKPVYLSALAS